MKSDILLSGNSSELSFNKRNNNKRFVLFSLSNFFF